MYPTRHLQSRGAADRRRVQQRPQRRSGFSLLELEVALILFGIALSGIGPHAVMYTKHLSRLEARFSPQATHFLIPSYDRWARKLGAAASITTVDPGSVTPAPDHSPMNDVQLTSLEKTLTGEEVTAHVTVQAASP
jgi:prepilin-type N-terminal cleavage/methylation domain-containing protein